ncbi:MAG: alpha-L-fucosidase, partial [Cyclobacteriaceae bacterium]|nr:alpha-L-fucosidase [Cyclobacteriaceae bacterium]
RNVYSLGAWKGEPVKDNRYINPYAEHIMMLNKIPITEYAKLADTFNPVDFNAEYIVGLAKKTGMKYLVFTTKHHDGFAMYDSKVSDYNIVKATPYKKDPLKMLAEACKKEGIKLCLYYSLGRDWNEPNAVAKENRRNTWDFPDKTGFSYQKYLDEKVKPQLAELLTNYGDISMIWFDTPEKTTLEQSLDLESFIKTKQSNCIINTRVGNKVGDVDEMSDNYIPESTRTKPWESPATMAESWGYSILDTEEYWKSSDELIEKLVEIRAKGGNYLLNIGPNEKGAVPKLAVERLNDMADWMAVNSQAIYSTLPMEKTKIHNGRITQSGNNIYVHLFEHPHSNTMIIYIDSDGVNNVSLLTKDGETKLNFKPTLGSGIMISLPKKLPFNSVSVIKIETN